MKKTKKAIITLVFLIPIGLIGLSIFALVGPMSKPITPQEMIGKYEVQLPDEGKENLELLSGGVCKQYIFLKDGKKFIATGKWKYRHGALSYNQLVLEDIHYSLSEFGDKINPDVDKVEKNLSIFLPIERTLFGHIKISLYGDQGIYYRKID